MRNVFKDLYILATRGNCVNIDGGKVFLMCLISDLIFFPRWRTGSQHSFAYDEKWDRMY